MNKTIQIDNWKLTRLSDGTQIPAHVPGDITYDLYDSGIIPDPYYADNFKKVGWVAAEDFDYTGSFKLTQEDCACGDISLSVGGIDTFADVYVNDVHICKTENMFLAYEPSIRAAVHSGENTIRVRMHATLKKMAEIDTKGYFGVFNIPRLFVRKAQCHFGWDWAPDLCGYGIWQPITVRCGCKHRINSVNYRCDNDGSVTVFTELNYCVNATTDNYGIAIDGTAEKKNKDTLRIRIFAPDGSEAAACTVPVEGKKNFCNLRVVNPKLWWPAGYGDQPLYRLSVTLLRGDVEKSTRECAMAFREIELLQKPTGVDTLGFRFCINGREIFVRGANWVPIDCFTGTIPDEKYIRLLKLAKEANFNLIRVWGGGIYERELFYDICDREGLMVWQDFMFACGDIPEDCPEWVENTLKECEYQVKRLRTHPSLVYWCGGNEKTGSYALQISHGDRFVDYTLHGLVETLDGTRPYVRQSPFSFSDVGNNSRSGETHCNSFEPSLTKGIANYRKTLNETKASFFSECAVMGPGSEESFRRFMPEDRLWPMNELWEDRLCDNPYASVLMTFAQRQALYVKELYSEAVSFRDFLDKASLIHREMLTAESDYARSRRGFVGGFLSWMYSDIWPTGTWSMIDYYTEPKQVYYGIRRAYAPIRVCFVQNAEGKQELFVINDTPELCNFRLDFGEKRIDGETLWKDTAIGAVKPGSTALIPMPASVLPTGTYLYASGTVGAEKVKTLYSVDFWRNVSFRNKYSITLEPLSETSARVSVFAVSFVKSLELRLQDNACCEWSDNFLDMEPGDTVSVTVTSDKPLRLETLTTHAFLE